MNPPARMSPRARPIPQARSGTPARLDTARIIGADPGSRSAGE